MRLIMNRFYYAKKFRIFAIIIIIIGIFGFLFFNSYVSILSVVGLSLLGWSLVCKNCGKIYLSKPLIFLFTGRGDGMCGHCGYRN